MRTLNFIFLSLIVLPNFSLYCQQDGPDTGLKTVENTLRILEFNQAWENHKNDNSKQNPYDKVIDNLYEQNSSVATYVKDITKEMRKTHMPEQPLVDPFYFKYPSSLNLPLSQMAEQAIENEITMIKVIKTLNSDRPSRIYIEENERDMIKNISKNIEDAVHRVKLPLSLSLSLNAKKTGSFMNHDLQKMSDRKRIDATITVNTSAIYKLQQDYFLKKPTAKDRINTYLFGIILHELAHLKYLHCIKGPSRHVQEYEADWYFARKNKNYAAALAITCNRFKTIFNEPASNGHPSDKDRYKNLKEIRRLKEAESRWIWGPKGYEKYGDPAYEKAFINWSEKQK